MNLIEEDFSRLTARDLLLQQHDRQKVLEEKITKHEESFEKFKEREFKKVSEDVESLVRFRSENVGVWKSITGLAVILGIIATLIALLK